MGQNRGVNPLFLRCQDIVGYIISHSAIGSMYAIYGDMDPINLPQSC